MPPQCTPVPAAVNCPAVGFSADEDESPRCLAWKLRRAATVLTPCKGNYFCPAQAVGRRPGVTHGLVNRWTTAHKLAGRSRRLAAWACLSLVVHARVPLPPAGVTDLHAAARAVARLYAPDALVWSVPNWNRTPAGLCPHVHSLIWTRSPDEMLAAARFPEEVAVRARQALGPRRGRGRPRKSANSSSTHPGGDRVRVECRELRDARAGGSPESLLRYALRARNSDDGRAGIEDERRLVRPPAGEGYWLVYTR